MNKEQIIQGIADRIKAEETKHSHSIPDWHKIAAAKIYATWAGTAIPNLNIDQLSDEWVFETNGNKWSNNDDTAGDNFGSFKAGALKVIELLSKVDSETDENQYSPYCPVCGSCGEDGCCSALSCQQHPHGDYCQTYLKELQFGYRMYRKLLGLVGEDEKYKDQIDKMWDETYDLTFKSE